MQYVEVLVSSTSYHGTEALTYACEEPFDVGTVVEVPLRNQLCLGIVLKNTSAKPNFETRAVVDLKIPKLPPHIIQLILWLKDYYPSPLGSIVQLFLPKRIPPKKQHKKDVLQDKEVEMLPELTTEQKSAIKSISPKGLHILHGSTGSGKTRVYLELALRAAAEGKSSLILAPEIGLTSQLSQVFQDHYPGPVHILHSQLTEATKRKVWLDINSAQVPQAIIGARSALFTPIHKLGLIVIDESHETSYKQDNSPNYHAAVVGAKLAELNSVPLILGSATPSIVDYYIAEQKNRPVIKMAQRAKISASGDKVVEVVDLKDKSNFTQSMSFSDKLINVTRDALGKGEQVLFFLNRRGTARVVMCTSCGWQSTCPNCDIPLVFHGDTFCVRCHSCNFSSAPPQSCGECHNTSVIFRTLGTKAIADEAQMIFPDAIIGRYDDDNKKSERIEHNFSSIHSGEVNLLIGTQILAKGLDLPKLSVVGIIIADTSLYIPDFSSKEKTFQLLNQVIGRVGRGHRAGKVVLQTYAPDSPLIKSAIKDNWSEFYTSELIEREKFFFPPFCFQLKIWCRRSTRQSAMSSATKLIAKLSSHDLSVTVEGPAPSFHERFKDKYQWQIIVKAKRRGELLKVISLLPSGWSYDIDPVNLL